MKKISLIFLIFMILIFSLNGIAVGKGNPQKAYLGLAGGEIAEVDLQTWEIEYFDIDYTESPPFGGTPVTAAIKYFPDENKLIYALEPMNRIYILDIETEENYELFSGKEIKSYRLRAPGDEEEIYVTFPDKIISYNVKTEDIISETKVSSIEDRVEFYEQLIPDDAMIFYHRNDFLELLIEGGIVDKDTTDKNDIACSNASIYLDGIYPDKFLVEKDNKVLIVEYQKDEQFEVIMESPEDFLDNEAPFDPNFPDLILGDNIIDVVDFRY